MNIPAENYLVSVAKLHIFLLPNSVSLLGDRPGAKGYLFTLPAYSIAYQGSRPRHSVLTHDRVLKGKSVGSMDVCRIMAHGPEFTLQEPQIWMV